VRVLEEAVADEELREEDKAWMQLVQVHRQLGKHLRAHELCN